MTASSVLASCHKRPIRGIALVCPRAANGHATAPPSTPRNARRFMSNPRLRRRHRNDKNEHFGRGLEWTSGTGHCAARPMSQMGQTEKYSKRADIFRSSADNRHPRWPFAGLSSGGRECSHSISNMASALPAPEQADRFYDLLAGWLDSFLLIRYRPRDPVCVSTAALRQKWSVASIFWECQIAPSITVVVF